MGIECWLVVEVEVIATFDGRIFACLISKADTR